MTQFHPDRRQFLTAIGSLAVAGATIPVLAGCGSGGGEQEAAGSFPEFDAATLGAIAAALDAGEPAVGGAKFFPDAGIVVTQPSSGDYVALSTTCTHDAGVVNRMSSGSLVCPLHGSRFDPATGAATAGPAQAHLPTKTVSDAGDTVTLS